MKNSIAFAAGVFAIASAVTAASAADISRRQVYTREAPAYAVPYYNWTGPYIGIQAGGGFNGGTFDSSGALGGITAGYNWQANRIVYGIEADIAATNIGGAGACFGGTCTADNSYLGTVRGRVGYAFDTIMPYVTGGLAFGDVRTTAPFAGVSDNNEWGYAVGLGAEFAISGPWTAKVEYLYVDLGNSGNLGGRDTDFDANIVRLGVNYRF